VRSIDLMPTLLDLVGIAPPDGVDGVSLAGYLEPGSADMDLAAYTETGIWLTDVPGMPPDHLRYPRRLDLLEVPNKQTGTLSIRSEYRDVINRAKDRMIRRGPWKLTYQPTTEGAIFALYNVERDPGVDGTSRRSIPRSSPTCVAACSHGWTWRAAKSCHVDGLQISYANACAGSRKHRLLRLHVVDLHLKIDGPHR
jgi:hypothetical protein